MASIGIIGYGDFGKLVADVMGGTHTIKAYSRNNAKVPDNIRAAFEEVCACDYVVPTIPLRAYDTVLAEVAKHIGPQTVLVDVCSVKVNPAERVKKHLPDTPLVATHPLFGPQTIQNGIAGHVFVLCDDVSDATQSDKLADFALSLGLDVVRMTAQEHDEQMAQVHALTFFVARTLLNMGVSDVALHTPSFGKLLGLIELERSHTQDLFETIQLGNPFASKIRQAFLDEATKIATQLDAEDRL